MRKGLFDMDKHLKKFKHFFTPEILKQNLTIAALFIAVYDNLKESIVDKVKYFYLDGIEDGKE